MKFVLFRHAHKGVTPFEDPELSLQGFEQAVRILNLVKTGRLPAPTRLFVSPRRRTSQTFFPLSRELGVKLEILPELDQHLNRESRAEFRKRIADFLEQLESGESSEVVFACTHFDWIEEAMTLIHCDRDLNTFEFAHWAPTQYAAFQLPPWTFSEKGESR